MNSINLEEIRDYVESHIGEFHNRKAEMLESLKLKKLLKRKNPYLFRAKNLLIAQDLVKSILDASISSSEETIFGGFLEGLAIFVCQKVYGGRKSSAEGIDLEFEKNDQKFLVSIKSGTNWANSRQLAKMKDDFKKAKRILNTNRSIQNTVAINGCCYGQESNPDKGEYLKLCGQEFWEIISGDERFFKKIIEPLGFKAKEKTQEFEQAYSRIINNFTSEFLKDFCTDGVIDWEKLTEFNSEKKIIRKKI